MGKCRCELKRLQLKMVFDSSIYLDVVRFSHLVFVILGMGSALLADIYVLGHLNQAFTNEMLVQLDWLHRVIWVGLLGMWVTGLALVGVRTGFDVSQFTPKLLSKFIVVGVLTINAVLLGRVAFPILRLNNVTPLLQRSLKHKLIGGWLGAVSFVCWFLALALGSSAVLKVAGWDVFVWLLPGAFGAALLAVSCIVLLGHWVRRPKNVAV